MLAQEQPRSLYIMLAIVFGFALLVLVGTLFWIWHNCRIAARGSRGLATRYSVPQYYTDAIGREIDIPERDVVRDAAVIRILSTPELKSYTTEDADRA